MPKVPQYQESQRFGPAPDARFTVNGRALSLASGGETWGAVDRAGGQMRATGDQMGDIALEAMREYNETVAMDRLNQAEAAILAMQAEQALRKGRDALGDAVASGSELIAQAAGGSGLAGPHGAAAGAGKDGKSVGVSGALRTGLDKLRGELTQGLNPAQQKLFDLAFTRRGQEVLRWGAGWEAQQQEVYTTGTEDGRKALDEQRILAHYGDPEQVSSALGNIQYVEQRRGKRLGLAPEAVEANMTQAMQKALLPMFDAMIDKGELGQARNALKLFGPDLGAAKAAEVWSRIQSRIQAQSEALAARAEADRRKAAAEAEKTALKGAVDGILADVAPYPTLEEQREAALARADALPEPVLRDRTRAEIAREMAWRQTTRDAADARAALDLCRAAREEGLSPLAWRERLDRADLSEGARALALAWSEAAPEGPESAARTMTLLRAIERGRAGSGRLTEDDVLAAGLHGGLSERQTRLALACLKDGAPVSVSRLDDICLDLHLPPDGHGRVEAPAWLYEGMLRDLARHGLLTPGKPLSDETLAQSVTRVWQRRQTALAARGPRIERTAPPPNFPALMGALRQHDPDAGKAVSDAFLQGYAGSVSGLALGDELDAVLDREAGKDGAAKSAEASGLAEQAAGFLGRMAGDAPALLAGGLLGKALAGAAGVAAGAGAASTGLAQGLGAAAGAGGLTEGVRAWYVDALRKGEVEDWDDFRRRAGSVLTEAGKGAGLNLALFGAGQGATAAARGLGAGSLLSGAAGVGAEGAVLAGGGAALEGRAPEGKDFAEAALMVLGGRAAGKAYRVGDAETRAMIWKLQDIYAKRGLPPRQAAEMLLKDPSGRSEKLLEEGRRHTRAGAELRAQGKPDRVPPTDFTDYRSPEHMAMLRDRLRAIRPEERDFIKALKPKDTVSQTMAQHTADNVWRDLGVKAVPVEVEPGRWALRVDRVPPPPSPDKLKQQLRVLYQAMKRGESCPTLDLGVIGPEEAARIRRCTGQDVLLEKRVLRMRDMEHADTRHGGERTKGQGSLREEDFLRYAEIVLDPDWIEQGTKPGSIRYMRRYGDGTVYVVEYNKSGKRLESRTMWRALPGGQPEILLGVPDGGEEGKADGNQE